MLRQSNNNNISTLICSNIYSFQSEQPWFVLSAAKYYDYLIPKDPAISHFYTFEANQTDNTTFAIPDGAVDIVFECDQVNPIIKVCGSTLQAKSAQFKHKQRYFGIRFMAGVIPSFLNIVADDIVNQELNLFDLLPEKGSLFSQISSDKDFLSQVALYEKFFNIKPYVKPSKLMQKLIHEIYNAKGNIPIKSLEALAGYTSRTIQRQFQKEMGMPPKIFSRIVRGQMAVHNIGRSEQVVLSDLASDLGFSDQSHFQREFKKLTSTTPLHYQRRIKHTHYLNKIRQIL